MKNSGGLLELKRMNRAHIKKMIYQKAPITRAEVAESLNLALPTVTTNVVDMLAEGILCEQELPGWEASPQGGRKPLALDFVPQAAYAVGIELGPYGTMGVVSDVRGNIIAQSKSAPASDCYETMLSQAGEQIRGLLDGTPREKVIGIGVGLPGFIETQQGVIRFSFREDWNKHTLAQDLADALRLPVVIDNNVRMRVVAEEMFSHLWRPDVFAYYFISRGIACPVMMKNGVWSGYTSGAGEIGHTIVQPGGPKCSRCGHHGCLDAVAGENAILKKCEKACAVGQTPILQSLAQKRPLDLTLAMEAQELGDEIVCSIFAEAIKYLGISLANTANLLSPGLVLVDGYIMRSTQNQEMLRDIVSNYLYGLNSDEVRIEFLPFDQYRGARGAAGRIIKKFWIQ